MKKPKPKIQATKAPKEEPVTEKVPAPLYVRPTWEPFESGRQSDGSYVTTWRHPNGEFEQWHGDKRVYGPDGGE